MAGFPNNQSNPAGAIPVYIAATSFANLTAITAGTQLKTGAGVLHSVIVNDDGTGSATIVLYDGTSTAGTKIATLGTATSQFTAFYGVAFNTGLFVVVTGTTPGDLTVTYS